MGTQLWAKRAGAGAGAGRGAHAEWGGACPPCPLDRLRSRARGGGPAGREKSPVPGSKSGALNGSQGVLAQEREGSPPPVVPRLKRTDFGPIQRAPEPGRRRLACWGRGRGFQDVRRAGRRCRLGRRANNRDRATGALGRRSQGTAGKPRPVQRGRKPSPRARTCEAAGAGACAKHAPSVRAGAAPIQPG